MSRWAAGLLAASLLLAGCTGGDAEVAARPASAGALEDCVAGDGPGTVLPAVELPCLAGGAPTTVGAMLDGRPALVNFWASWCAPCVRELPLLQRRHTAGEVQVLGVLSADPGERWRDLARRTGVTFPTVRDDRRRFSAALHLPIGAPATLFVRPDGSLAYVHYGAFTADTLDDLVREHFGTRV